MRQLGIVDKGLIRDKISGRIVVEELGGIFIEGGLGGVPMDGFQGNTLLPESIQILSFHYREVREFLPVTIFIKV